MAASRHTRRALAGAVLLDFAVSPLFIWDVFTRSLTRELQVPGTALSAVISAGLAAFTAGVLAGGHLADAVAPRRLAVIAGGGACAGLGTAALAPTLPVLLAGFGVVLGAATGLGYATAVRVAGTVGARRGSAVAVVVSAYAAGAVVLAPVARELLALVGRAGTFAALAGGIGILAVISAALLPGTAPPPRSKSASGGPSSPYRAPVPALWLMFALGSAPALVAFAHAGEFAGNPQAARVASASVHERHHAPRKDEPPILELPVLQNQRQIIDTVIRRQPEGLFFIVGDEKNARETSINLLARAAMRVRVIPERRRGLADGEHRPPCGPGVDHLVRAAIEFSRDEQPVPMDSRIFTERIGDGDLYVVAAMDAQRRAKIVAVVAEGPAFPLRKERGATVLRPERD